MAGDLPERLKINPQTVRNWIDRGELPAVRVGARRVRVRESDFDAFVAAGEMRPVSDSDMERAGQWKNVRTAVEAASAAARVRDQVALQDAVEALTTAARALLETSRP